jgi:hypothetical protein
MSEPSAPGPPLAADEPSGTLIEMDAVGRQAISAPPVVRGPVPYRPTARPPVPLLTVLDDGRAEGEVVRIREPRFVVGRTEGNLRIPLDGRMSARHVEIAFRMVDDAPRWVVTDLHSTHGLFVRVSRTALIDAAEIMVGSGRYRFDARPGEPSPPANDPGKGHPDAGDDPDRPRGPALVELLGADVGRRFVVTPPESWIGTDPACAIARPDDPFCEPRHARIFKSPELGWAADHNRTRNGLWLRVPEIVVDVMVHFQAGEQRFLLRMP